MFGTRVDRGALLTAAVIVLGLVGLAVGVFVMLPPAIRLAGAGLLVGVVLVHGWRRLCALADEIDAPWRRHAERAAAHRAAEAAHARHASHGV